MTILHLKLVTNLKLHNYANTLYNTVRKNAHIEFQDPHLIDATNRYSTADMRRVVRKPS